MCDKGKKRLALSSCQKGSSAALRQRGAALRKKQTRQTLSSPFFAFPSVRRGRRIIGGWVAPAPPAGVLFPRSHLPRRAAHPAERRPPARANNKALATLASLSLHLLLGTLSAHLVAPFGQPRVATTKWICLLFFKTLSPLARQASALYWPDGA